MVLCAVLGCNSSSSEDYQIYSFHRFPTKPVLREKWLRMLNRPNWTPSSYSAICSKHFPEICFFASNRRLLRSGSVPTIAMPVVTQIYENIDAVPNMSNDTEDSGLSPREIEMMTTIKKLKKKLGERRKLLKNKTAKIKRMRSKIIKLNEIIENLKPSFFKKNFTSVTESCSNKLLIEKVMLINKKLS